MASGSAGPRGSKSVVEYVSCRSGNGTLIRERSRTSRYLTLRRCLPNSVSSTSPNAHAAASASTPAATSSASCFSEVCFTAGCVLTVPEPVTAVVLPVGR